MRIVSGKNCVQLQCSKRLAYEWLFGVLDEKRITEIAKTLYPAEQVLACSIAKD